MAPTAALAARADFQIDRPDAEFRSPRAWRGER
jgi:hypothetical protein